MYMCIIKQIPQEKNVLFSQIIKSNFRHNASDMFILNKLDNSDLCGVLPS